MPLSNHSLVEFGIATGVIIPPPPRFARPPLTEEQRDKLSASLRETFRDHREKALALRLETSQKKPMAHILQRQPKDREQFNLGQKTFTALLSPTPDPSFISDAELLAALYFCQNEMTLPAHGFVTRRELEKEKKQRGLS
jgi:hypothetical protein